MTLAGILIMAFVTLQRLGELWLAQRNTRRLLAAGATEVGASHYPLILAVHSAWLAALWWLGPGKPVNWFLLAVFVMLQMARAWVIATLGGRWTTRIIVLQDAEPVGSGPYRYLSHPNYLVVALEIAVLPLTFGLVGVALLFSLLNAAVLTIRIRAENRALGI